MRQRRALVIGGSIGGLFAADLLRATGWDVAVFERARGNLGDRGAGVGTREELFSVMRRAGVAVDPSIGVPVLGRVGLDRDGRIALRLPVRSVTSGWAHIWQPLKEALPQACYHEGKALVRVEQDEAGVTAMFEDGSRETGCLLVGADGPLSAVRAQMLPDLAPRYAGYVAWRGVVEADGIDPALHELMLHHMIFGFPPGELMLSIPMPAPLDGSRRGLNRCHFVWFRPVTEAALADLCAAAGGPRNGAWIVQRHIRAEAIEALKASARATLPPQLAALVAAAPRIILQPIFDLESPRLVFGRAVLLGDAAFVARPHVATGVMKAALDAERLADALAGSGDNWADALAGYDRERGMFGRWLVARGRHIAAYFETGHEDPQRRIETLMREYGAAGVIADEPITVRQLG